MMRAPQRRAVALETHAREVLENAWDDERGYCFPNRRSYPHLWLWDSCFHSIAWSAVGDARALTELEAVFAGQLPSGFLPHMRYASPTDPRGPLRAVSSFTQPPVYARALRAAADAGLTPPQRLWDAAATALDALWRLRLRDGLLVIVHPWESGADDSPRWDSWVGSARWRRRRWTRFDRRVLASTSFAATGEALDNRVFVAAPAAFNAIAADAATVLGEALGDESWSARGRALAAALDAATWDDEIGMWADVAVRGGGASVRVPTLDGLLPALSTTDPVKAARALDRLGDPRQFAGPFGPRYLRLDDPLYRPRAYWRGGCWPQLTYLCVVAALRWNRGDLAEQLARSAGAGVERSRYAEYWDPETGRGHGARPQTWAAVVAATASLLNPGV